MCLWKVTLSQSMGKFNCLKPFRITLFSGGLLRKDSFWQMDGYGGGTVCLPARVMCAWNAWKFGAHWEHEGTQACRWWSNQATSEPPYGGSFSDEIGHIFLIAKLFSVICSSVHPDQYNRPYSNILKFMSIQVKYRFLLSSDLKKKKKVSQAILCGSMCVSVFLCVIFLSNA